jgi:hypothetical protein
MNTIKFFRDYLTLKTHFERYITENGDIIKKVSFAETKIELTCGNFIYFKILPINVEIERMMGLQGYIIVDDILEHLDDIKHRIEMEVAMGMERVIRHDKLYKGKKKIESLTKLTEEISDAKTKVAVLRSKKEDALKRLREEFGAKTVEGAEKILETKKSEMTKLKESIEKKFKTLKEEYSW